MLLVSMRPCDLAPLGFCLGRVEGGTRRSAEADILGTGEGQVMRIWVGLLGGHSAGCWGQRTGCGSDSTLLTGWLGGARHGWQLCGNEPQGGGNGGQRGAEGPRLEAHEGVFTEQDVLDLVVVMTQVVGGGRV